MVICILNPENRKRRIACRVRYAAVGLTVLVGLCGITSDCVWGHVTPAAGDVTWTPVVNLNADYEHQVGDLITYEASVAVRDEGTWGEAVVLAQQEMPAGLLLQEDSVRISGAEGDAEITGQGWSVSCDRLAYGEELTVTYDVLVTQEANGQELFSEVSVNAANLSSAPQEGTPYIDVWNNTADLSIEVVTDQMQAEEGAAVNFMICLTNGNDQTVARNVILTVEDLENLVTLTEDVQYSGVPEVVSVPARDYLSHIEMTERENTCEVIVQQGTLAFRMDYLPANMPVALLLSGTMTEQAAEGGAGQIAVSADNAVFCQADLAFAGQETVQDTLSDEELSVEEGLDDAGEEETADFSPYPAEEAALDEEKEKGTSLTDESDAPTPFPIDAAAMLLLLALLITTICIVLKNAYSGRKRG